MSDNRQPRHDAPRDILDEVIADMFGRPRPTAAQEMDALRSAAARPMAPHEYGRCGR